MRIEPEILYDVIPKFLRDGWQVVCTVEKKIGQG